TLKQGRIFARGSADNKGQIFAHIAGIEKTIAEKGDLPVNLIVFVEGEEEVGSPNLENFLQEHRSDCECEIIAVSDSGMVAAGIPTFAYGLRGICCIEVRLRGPAQDLHSGIFGGSVANPATVLSRMIASLHDLSGRTTVPGFYDQVLPIQPWERELWEKLPFDKADWLRTTGSPALAGENGYTFLEHVWARPTAEVNGLVSGYQGEGPKTIVPSLATAKLSFRLVPRQDPEKIKELVTEFLKAQCPPSVMMEIVYQHQGKPYLVEPNSKFGMAAQRALMQTFNKPVALVREGGSIPITQSFKDIIGADTLLLGLALPDSRAHSPNENFTTENFYAGMRLNRHLLEEISEVE
ncbi:MAG: M20/M25/M40 family metallo-hydrolase, partial [Verrucomicrobia bacterium]|nr:M20/M25/M40 family metallo-hydrolase [Verrucomicrobiota bacterium]